MPTIGLSRQAWHHRLRTGLLLADDQHQERHAGREICLLVRGQALGRPARARHQGRRPARRRLARGTAPPTSPTGTGGRTNTDYLIQKWDEFLERLMKSARARLAPRPVSLAGACYLSQPTDKAVIVRSRAHQSRQGLSPTAPWPWPISICQGFAGRVHLVLGPSGLRPRPRRSG